MIAQTAVHVVLAATLMPQVWDPPGIRVFPDHNAVVADPRLLPAMLRDGEALFRTRFNILDGAGRPAATGDSKPTRREPRPQEMTRLSGPDAMSCLACHNQPKIGGAGDFSVNVFNGAHLARVPLLDMSPGNTNERNTLSVLGSGAIEMVAREMSAELRALRADAQHAATASGQMVVVALTAKGISYGSLAALPDGSFDQSKVVGVDDDLIVRPFGVKGVAASLREFTIAALNQHHGIQAVERFGWERTGRRDFDEDGVEIEFTIGQLSALVLFQASLPPLNRSRSDDPLVLQGEKAFHEVGCTACHVPFLPLRSIKFEEPNPFNRPGTAGPDDVGGTIDMPLPVGGSQSGLRPDGHGGLQVWAFTDLKRHRICDDDDPFFCNEKIRQDNVPVDYFLTSKLWDLAESAPFGHRGDCSTVSEAIRHHSAEAAAARNAFLRLRESEKRALVMFLLTLGAE
jgi:hypothetical protein